MTIYKVISPTTEVRSTPDAEAPRGKIESQLLLGETFVAEEDLGDWLRGTCSHDGYPGYVEKKYLTCEFSAATHIVNAQRSTVYRDADIKSPVRHTLGLGAQLTVVATDYKFAQLDNGMFVPLAHIAPLSMREDFVDVALRFLETPYVWAGRSGLGVDCSGLVQVSLARAGHNVLRDCDQQESVVGKDAETSPRQRGDIVYFPGHVGIMIDTENIVQAAEVHMKTVIEPLDVVTQRNGGINSIRRII